LARSNVSSPGVRIEVQPSARFDALATYRLLWLASSKDAWTTAAFRDSTVACGSLVGPQIEARVRFHVVPQNLSFDVGGALVLRGDFAKNAPGALGEAAAYVYAQVTGTMEFRSVCQTELEPNRLHCTRAKPAAELGGARVPRTFPPAGPIVTGVRCP
jgi:hypothetical protein